MGPRRSRGSLIANDDVTRDSRGEGIIIVVNAIPLQLLSLSFLTKMLLSSGRDGFNDVCTPSVLIPPDTNEAGGHCLGLNFCLKHI